MDQLPPHDERAWQSFQPGAQRHRSDPLRHPPHRGPLLPLIRFSQAGPRGIKPLRREE
ncbi:hypothetical protein QEO92_08230 [Neorhizobium petrolearium]|uniref:Uncharacterized protein n=1 Tax=Neorhizobium petrolearium TaxID=515361 RepID=A0ABY8M9A4_9HYPH|nr:hypothetical protein [Neorhizobium petrolearium]WGI71130.1 hypothetical protein QEO92_08230 [Neorhizobium petrolearium]